MIIMNYYVTIIIMNHYVTVIGPTKLFLEKRDWERKNVIDR